MQTLELNKISYKNILSNINLKMESGNNISILGNIGSGKSTLAKILANKIEYKGTYLINKVEIVASNAYVVDRFVSLVDKNYLYDNERVVNILFDELDEEEKVKKLVRYFDLNDILNIKMDDLSDENKYYILIILNLLKKESFLVIDDILCYLRVKQIDKIYKYAKKHKVTIINITSRLDDVFYSQYLICLYNSNIAMEGNILNCLKEEKLLKRLGFKLPFMFDLSLQLNYYEVLDDIYLNSDEMVKKIWK